MLLLIFPRNLPTCKFSVYKKNVQATIQDNSVSSAKKPQYCIQLPPLGFQCFSDSSSTCFPPLRWSINAAAQIFPIDKQELIEINSFCCYFFSTGRGIPFQDYKYILILPRNRGLLYLVMEHQVIFHNHSEARYSKFWWFAVHSKAFVYSAINTYILKRKFKQSALQKTTSVNFAKTKQS